MGRCLRRRRGMRLLTLSDIHAKAEALDAAFRAGGGRWDRAVCLGDVVGYGPDPNEVTDRVRALNIRAIRGDPDESATGVGSTHEFSPLGRSPAHGHRLQLS